LHFSKLLNRLAVLNSEIGLFAGDGVGDGDGVNDGEVVVGLAITTPLFQSNFFPDLIQVKVLLAVAETFPTFGHGEPALTAALAGFENSKIVKAINEKRATRFFLAMLTRHSETVRQLSY
jgi:hypothetical protein